MEKQKKLSRISSYCSYVYLLFLCVGTGLVGGALIFLCRESFPEFRDTVGLANSLCFLTGIVMSSFVISWIIYIAFLTSYSSPTKLAGGSRNCKQKKREQATEEKNASWRIVTGQICFFLLLLTALSELTCLGFMWWTSFSLNDKFLVEEDCFCFKNHQGQVTQNILLGDGLDVRCPMSRDINCVSTYGELEVSLSSDNSRSNLHVTLKNCQRLDQYDQQDSNCLNFTNFWFLFKMLRIVLPILAVMKLPFLLMNCLEVLSKNIDRNHCEDQEFYVAEVRSPLSLMSPRTRPKASKVASSPYFGLRLAPLGEEEARQSSLINNGLNIPVKKGNIVGFLARQDSASPPLAEDDIVNDTDSVFKSDSPHSSIQDCVISTPIQRGMKSPSFDLSKVIRPVFPSAGSEEYNYRPAAPPAPTAAASNPSLTASIPTSTFKSTLPAVFRHQTDLEVDRSHEEDVFYTPAFSHHPFEHIPMARSIRLGSLPDPEVPPRHNAGKTKRFSLSRTKQPIATGPDMDEIIKIANTRSKSVTSKIDWTKMP